jgi:hypothetical protein
MTALTRNPTNTNLLHPNKFSLSFQRLPEMQYFCQGASIPGISIGEAPRNTPFVDLYSPGEKAIYDLLNVTFFVDEELKSWLGVHDWIRAMAFPEKFEEYLSLERQSKFIPNVEKPQFSDATLTLYSTSYKPYYRFKFFDCFPISLSSFVVSASDTPENVITADSSFRFAYYNVEKLF